MGRDKKPTVQKKEAAASEGLPTFVKSGTGGVSISVRAKPGSKVSIGPCDFQRLPAATTARQR
jgi:hypothetical protein